jgi:Ni,Fe-hydrogenase III large subunit
VYARAIVRWLEVQRSLDFLLETLGNIPAGATLKRITKLKPKSLAFGASETWSGEAMHVALSDESGDLAFVKVKDPSIHNWFGLALALRGMAISDFPVCNKSFSLSYAGHDL